MHTAVKIAPEFEEGVVYVLDASRSVTVAGSLLNKDQKPEFLQQLKTEYRQLKESFDSKKSTKNYLPYSAAKKKKTNINWGNFEPVTPSFTGTQVFENISLDTLRPFIDWKPFFIAWELHGNFPEILTDSVVGIEASKLFKDANDLLDQIIAENWLQAKATIGFWEAASKEDDVFVKTNTNTVQLSFLRQQIQKAADQPNLSLADFIVPVEHHKKDHIGAFAVTIHGIEKHIKAFELALDDYNKIILQALADRLAEALAEYLHLKVRTEYWAYATDEHLSNEELIKEKYLGIRPAPGYPACPDHTEKYKLFDLLNATETIGINLTESLAMYPASSVCGWYFANPQSQYFGIGKIQRDQLLDYAARKNMSLEVAERWLSPVLD
jgi:5-methyltetrahydrofolate--homocysteine methyltransferase